MGSLDIVGNPVDLFKNISAGVVDMYQKPKEGFGKEFSEGGRGIIKGTKSLFKNVISETFNSISKATCALASGLSNISLVRFIMKIKVNLEG